MRTIPNSVERIAVPSGYGGTRKTIEIMARTLREQYLHPRMRARARELFADLPSLDTWAEVQRVFDWVLSSVRYMRDPIGAEHVTKPVSLDEQIDQGVAAEDCESMALYAATLLAAAGIPSAFEIQGRDPSKPKSFRHCALVVENPRTGERQSFDVVGAIEFPGTFGFGDTLHRRGDPVERFDLDGKRAPMLMTSDDMLSAALGDTGSEVRAALDIVKGVAPVFGPYGAIVSGVVQVGEGVWDVVDGEYKYRGPASGPPAGTTFVGAPPPAKRGTTGAFIRSQAGQHATTATFGPGSPPKKPASTATKVIGGAAVAGGVTLLLKALF